MRLSTHFHISPSFLWSSIVDTCGPQVEKKSGKRARHKTAFSPRRPVSRRLATAILRHKHCFFAEHATRTRFLTPEPFTKRFLSPGGLKSFRGPTRLSPGVNLTNHAKNVLVYTLHHEIYASSPEALIRKTAEYRSVYARWEYLERTPLAECCWLEMRGECSARDTEKTLSHCAFIRGVFVENGAVAFSENVGPYPSFRDVWYDLYLLRRVPELWIDATLYTAYKNTLRIRIHSA